MVYGENSPEAVRAGIDLGAFYNEHGKPDSAARNLIRASQSARATEVQAEDLFLLAVELADASLSANAPTKADRARQIAQADAALAPYAEFTSDSKVNCFRRDLYLARVRAFKGKWADALALYERALAGYADAHPEEAERTDAEPEEGEERCPEEANMCVEAAQIAERIEGCDRAPQLYRRAYDLYTEKGCTEDAKEIEAKAGPPAAGEDAEKAGEQPKDEPAGKDATDATE
jgi:hypothetical protein